MRTRRTTMSGPRIELTCLLEALYLSRLFMTTRKEKLTAGVRTAMALLAAAVLTAPAYLVAAHKNLYGDVFINHHPEKSLSFSQQIPAQPQTEKARDKIATDGKPVGSQYPCLVLPLILKTDNTEDRYKTQNDAGREISTSSVYHNDRYSVLTSTSRISSRLGRQLTLVGAKPSGTS